MKLWRTNYPPGSLDGVKTHDLFVWTPINIETGEMEMEPIRIFNDELTPLARGWEWRKFRLTLVE